MENRISQGYWIWGQFDKDSMDELKLIYKKVNEVFNGPFFNVHITISGPLISINNNIIDNFYSLKKKFQSIELDLNRYLFSEDIYESFFIDVQNSKILMNFKCNIDREFNILNNNYKPHISLFYGEESKNNKKKLIYELPKLPNYVNLYKLCLVKIDENINKWYIEHEIFL